MEARYFRYLFDNTKNGIIHSGYVWDSAREKRAFFLYLSGALLADPVISEVPRFMDSELEEDEPVFLCVLGDYTISYVQYLLGLVKRRKVENVILPYIVFLRRRTLAYWLKERGKYNKEVYDFLRDPQEFLRNAGVSNVYYVCGNGTDITNEENLREGNYFEPASQEDLDIAERLEGKKVPLVKAGYIVNNEWLFYFGTYGNSLKYVEQLIQRYCTVAEYKELVKNPTSIASQPCMRRLINAYARTFGVASRSIITMYQGPLHDAPQEVDSLFTTKIFSREQCCNVAIPDGHKTCALKCLYQNDYDLLKRHKNDQYEKSKFGVLLTGNVNMNIHFYDIAERYKHIWKRIRAISVPNCGRIEYWNAKLLETLDGKDLSYFVCASNEYTSADVIKEIMMSNSYYRFINVNEKYGFCFSGYLVPKQDH